MRQFRGKTQNEEWVYGWYFEAGNSGYIVPKDAEMNSGQLCEYESEPPMDFLTDFVEVEPATVGQSTGLKDRSGKEIYEGDNVLNDRESIGIVTWDENNACFMIWGGCFYDYMGPKFVWNELEVIGNIRDKEAHNG